VPFGTAGVVRRPPSWLEAYDFSQVSRLLDVGGGSGELIGAIANKYKTIQAAVFDLERCAEAANEHLDPSQERDSRLER